MSITTGVEPLDQAPTGHVVLPVPVVDWTTVVKAGDPAREPTRGRLRELRKKGQLGDGITVTRRGERGLQGRANYYSVLSALAIRCRQAGHDDDAVQLERSASELEARFREQLRGFLSSHDLGDLAAADFAGELAVATAEKLAEWQGLPEALFAAAVVAGLDADVAHLYGSSPRGHPIEVDLPRLLLNRHSLVVGDVVWVFSRVVRDAVVVELLPAIRVQLRDWKSEHVQAKFAGLVDIARTREPSAADDGLTDMERTDYADRYRATGAAGLTAEQMAALTSAAAAGEMPRRRLRPAG